VRWYCREAGVRNLEKHIEKICRKLALETVSAAEGEEKLKWREDWYVRIPFDWLFIRRVGCLTWGLMPRSFGCLRAVSEKNLEEYVGKRVFTSDRLYEDKLPPGVVMGLSWTAMGGASLYIEVSSTRHRSGGGGSLSTTGQMGSVMEESTKIAYTFARKKLEEFQGDNVYFDSHDLHMHVPEVS